MYKPMRKSIKKIRGPKGTRVTLEIVPRSDSSGATKKRIELVRDEIKLEDQAATGHVQKVVLGGVTNRFGYIKFREFYGTMDKKPSDPSYRSCSRDINAYIGRFQEPGSEMDGLVLDLRGNGGGSLREAVLLTQLFCPEIIPVVQIRETQNLYILPSFPDQPQFSCRKPMVVLIDRLSASASEIVAGALRDLGRAVVIGDTATHGKGTVQTVMPMGGERFGSMKITTARFYRINGSSTQLKGVPADIRLPSTLDGLDMGEDALENALPWSRIESAQYRPVWDVERYIPRLQQLSSVRVAKSERFQRHLKAVSLFREATKRKEVPLEYRARLSLMRQEREMRKLDDAQAYDDEESAEETALLQAEEGKAEKDDVVLQEAYHVLADLVRLSDGGEMPPARETNRGLPAWLRALAE
jgi:carboxyl-terminal processing protease